MAKNFVYKQMFYFSLIFHLILEKQKKATQYDPVQVQTGPALRDDHNILQMHQHLLEQASRPDLKEIYQLLSQAIITRHHV